ncbi:MAG: PEP-CTERM sorting domain-containing protein [Armatimonadota bacterium]
MRGTRFTIGLMTLLWMQHAWSQVAGYTPPTGYYAFSLELSGGAVAVSPSGRLAVARNQFGGGATITIYDRIRPNGRQVVASISDSRWQFFGGLAWRDENTLVFSENGDLDTVLEWRIGTGVVSLAPEGSTPNVADVYVLGNQVLALGADGPNANKLYRIADGAATVIISAYGNGYAGGLGLRNGQLYLGDTNDPNFAGNPGQVFRYLPVFDANGLLIGANFIDTLSLAGGGGSGLATFVFDSEGDLIASTGRTLTQLRGTTATPFGTFGGAFPFPFSLAYFGTRFEPFDGDGLLIVDGSFTAVGGLFAVTPIPEPNTLGALVAGLVLLRLHRRRTHGRA